MRSRWKHSKAPKFVRRTRCSLNPWTCRLATPPRGGEHSSRLTATGAAAAAAQNPTVAATANDGCSRLKAALSLQTDPGLEVTHPLTGESRLQHRGLDSRHNAGRLAGGEEAL